MKKALTIVYIILCIKGYTQVVSGSVRDVETREPLAFVSIQLSNTTIGTTTNEEGNFSLEIPTEHFSKKMIFSYVGYKTDSIKLSQNQQRYVINLRPNFSELQEVVVVSGTLKEVTKSNSPIPIEIYTPALFFKNPTPNIFESLAMVNGVQPQLNCNVCNTGDIHINGMEGPYTMVLIDGMPIVSSLSTVYGLAGIPNSMVKRIEVIKGPSSTLYGSEAVAGLINIITKDAGTAPRLKIDAFTTSYLEHNVDISTRWKTSKANAVLGVNYFNYSNKVDKNNDNFTDVTLQDRVSLFNKWEFNRKASRLSTVAVRYVKEYRWGGELQWNENLRGSDEIYAESIYTDRVELISNYQLPTSEKIFLDVSYNFHLQDSYYGTNKYLANQHVGFSQIRWEKSYKKHNLLAGLPFRFIYYDDNTVGTMISDGNIEMNDPMKTYLPGLFIQDELKIGDKITLLNGLRYDQHNIHGAIISPRMSAKYSPTKNTTYRISGGNGFRVVNLFTEDHAALTGARQVIIKNELKPEESWNFNVNMVTQIPHRAGFINLDGSFFYTYFTNKIVGDFITDPESIIYDNLNGHAISKGATLNTEFAFTSGLKIIAGATFMEVYQVEQNNQGDEFKIPQLFAPKFSGTYSVSYTLAQSNITIDLTGRFNGPMYLPIVPNDYRPEKSPWYTLTNLQITKSFSNGLELYGGCKNLFNFIPKDPLLRPFDPFDQNTDVNNPYNYTFDTAYNYAPMQGIKGFLGVRYTLQ